MGGREGGAQKSSDSPAPSPPSESLPISSGASLGLLPSSNAPTPPQRSPRMGVSPQKETGRHNRARELESPRARTVTRPGSGPPRFIKPERGPRPGVGTPAFPCSGPWGSAARGVTEGRVALRTRALLSPEKTGGAAPPRGGPCGRLPNTPRSPTGPCRCRFPAAVWAGRGSQPALPGAPGRRALRLGGLRATATRAATRYWSATRPRRRSGSLCRRSGPAGRPRGSAGRLPVLLPPAPGAEGGGVPRPSRRRSGKSQSRWQQLPLASPTPFTALSNGPAATPAPASPPGARGPRTLAQRRARQLGPVLGEGVPEALPQAAQVGQAAVQVEHAAVRPLGADLEELLLVAAPADDEPADAVHPAAAHEHVHERGALKHSRGHAAGRACPRRRAAPGPRRPPAGSSSGPGRGRRGGGGAARDRRPSEVWPGSAPRLREHSRDGAVGSRCGRLRGGVIWHFPPRAARPWTSGLRQVRPPPPPGAEDAPRAARGGGWPGPPPPPRPAPSTPSPRWWGRGNSPRPGAGPKSERLAPPPRPPEPKPQQLRPAPPRP